ERLIKRLRSRVGFTSDTNYEASETSLIMPLDSGLLMTGLIDAPYPEAEWKDLAARAWQWPEAAAVHAQIAAHLIVSCSYGNAPRLQAHLKHAAVVDEILSQVTAVGVVWGSELNSPDVFSTTVAHADAGDSVPTTLWTLYQLSQHGPETTVVSTLGLDAFGLMEIEANPAPKAPADAFGLVDGLASYLMQNGPVVGDGDTFGGTVEERITVRHAPSFRDGVGTVYQIDFGLPPQMTAEAPKPGFLARLFGRTPRT
ncbi:MAG: DUF4261 domain-containing protein, partial [Pseudomonadota bacterium]